jgi:hypothetical protein
VEKNLISLLHVPPPTGRSLAQEEMGRGSDFYQRAFASVQGEGFQLSMNTVVDPYAEAWICSVYPIPIDEPADVNSIEFIQTEGLHHMTLSTPSLFDSPLPHGMYNCEDLYTEMLADQVTFYGNQGFAEGTMFLPEGVGELFRQLEEGHVLHSAGLAAPKPRTPWTFIERGGFLPVLPADRAILPNVKRHQSPEKQLSEPAEKAGDSPVQLQRDSPAWAAQAQATHGNAYVQMMIKEQLQAKGELEGGEVQELAAEGVSGPGSSLPHQDEIQSSFEHHDISDVKAHTGGSASQAAESIGADAYATGTDVAFDGSSDLHTEAHEAAHVVQQQAGVSLEDGVGQAGDPYEQHADKVADKVVQGKSAAGLLDQMSGGGGDGLQKKAVQKEEGLDPDQDRDTDQDSDALQSSDASYLDSNSTQPVDVEVLSCDIDDPATFILEAGPSANEKNLALYQSNLTAACNRWNYNFEPSYLRMQTDQSSNESTEVLVLYWQTEWGDFPPSNDVGKNGNQLDGCLARESIQFCPGWKLVGGDLKPRLKVILSEANNPISIAARDQLYSFLGESSFNGLSPEDQSVELASLLEDAAVLPQVFSSVATAPDARPYVMTGPTVEKGHQFRGIKADSDTYQCQVSSFNIPIYSPHAPDPSQGHLHTADQACHALATLPDESLSVVKTITLNPQQNPDDAYWATKYNNPNFRSYMTAGAGGDITIYPSSGTPSQAQMDTSTIHETGHTWSKKEWGDDYASKAWAPWIAAIAADKTYPSSYAKNSPGEDVSETLMMYVTSQGTPLYEEYKRIYPNRFRILESEFGSAK